jgi:hypothetical protein
MTSVSNISSMLQPTANDNQHSPEKDFALELAKYAQESEGGAARGVLGGKTGESSTQSTSDASATSQVELSAVAGTGVRLAAAGLALLEQYTAITSPTGITEALLATRVFGWHALPQAFLSEWALPSSNGAEGKDASVAPQSSVSTAETSPIPMPAISASWLQVAPGYREQERASEVVAEERQSGAHPESITNEDEVLPLIADASAPDYWAERSLRYSRSPDGSSVAWLRDFRIEDGKIEELISNVLSEAKANRLMLSRIMLNGREAWSSPSAAKTNGEAV